MDINKFKQSKIARRHRRVRAKISGTSARPRLSAFRSIKGLYLQLIDDEAKKTLASASSLEIKDKEAKSQVAFKTGELLAKKALALNIKEVVFDRGAYKYHGRIKSAADGARSGGLQF
jgi:large subunit ribosomal protein L18